MRHIKEVFLYPSNPSQARPGVAPRFLSSLLQEGAYTFLLISSTCPGKGSRLFLRFSCFGQSTYIAAFLSHSLRHAKEVFLYQGNPLQARLGVAPRFLIYRVFTVLA